MKDEITLDSGRKVYCDAKTFDRITRKEKIPPMQLRRLISKFLKIEEDGSRKEKQANICDELDGCRFLVIYEGKVDGRTKIVQMRRLH